MPLTSALLALAILVVLPAGYALVAHVTLQRFGRGGLALFLVGSSFGLSTLGSLRARGATPDAAAYRPFETHFLWMVSLYALGLFLALLPLTLRIARKSPAASSQSRATRAVRAIPWFVVGLVGAFIGFLALDIAGVPFLPPQS